jgi:hypothetical protein
MGMELGYLFYIFSTLLISALILMDRMWERGCGYFHAVYYFCTSSLGPIFFDKSIGVVLFYWEGVCVCYVLSWKSFVKIEIRYGIRYVLEYISKYIAIAVATTIAGAIFIAVTVRCCYSQMRYTLDL